MKPGTKIEDALMLNDVVLDVNVTPNRPDCNSVVGIARELCAMYGKTFKEPDLSFKCVAGDVKDYVDIQIETTNCERYSLTFLLRYLLPTSN